MLRYFCLLIFLVCIHVSFCYAYTRGNVANSIPGNKESEDNANVRQRRRIVGQRKFRNRRDFDVNSDKDPVAQIDVAYFIKTPADEYLEENDPYDSHADNIHEKTYNDYGSIIDKDMNENLDENENYLEIDENNSLESPQSSKLDMSSDKYNNNKPTGVSDYRLRSKIYDGYNEHHQEKKCALGKIKFPFFSHNKSATIKGKNNMKRKLYSFNIFEKDKLTSNANDDESSERTNSVGKQSLYKYYNINKRSYIEQLCPDCKRKFISKTKKIRDKLNSQFNYKDKSSAENKRKTQNLFTTNSEDINNSEYIDELDKGEVNYEDPMDDRRTKREGTNKNLEIQKELEDLEKRVESVSVNSPAAFN